MTQRERLAGLIDETYHHDPWEMADSLLANGVRVFTPKMLSEALHRLYCAGIAPMHSSPDHSAQYLLAILDNIEK